MILQITLIIIACGLFLYAIWTFIKLHWKMGEPWTTHKAHIELLRAEVALMEEKGDYTPEQLRPLIENFNKVAKSLRLPPYKGVNND